MFGKKKTKKIILGYTLGVFFFFFNFPILQGIWTAKYIYTRGFSQIWLQRFLKN
jgi:hypothetical protein